MTQGDVRERLAASKAPSPIVSGVLHELMEARGGAQTGRSGCVWGEAARLLETFTFLFTLSCIFHFLTGEHL